MDTFVVALLNLITRLTLITLIGDADTPVWVTGQAHAGTKLGQPESPEHPSPHVFSDGPLNNPDADIPIYT